MTIFHNMYLYIYIYIYMYIYICMYVCIYIYIYTASSVSPHLCSIWSHLTGRSPQQCSWNSCQPRVVTRSWNIFLKSKMNHGTQKFRKPPNRCVHMYMFISYICIHENKCVHIYTYIYIYIYIYIGGKM